MHKIMQGLPISSMPLSLREALKDMKSNLAPIPREVVEAQLNSMVERSKGSIERIEVVKSLGAASIAQTFLCKCYGRDFPNGREVAIKLLRPDVRNRMMREKDIMIECAKATDASGGMLATYEGILKNVEREMDFTIESEYVKAGKIYNRRHKDVKSMELNDIIGATTGSMVAEKASGTTVDKYLEEIDEKIEEIKSRFYTIEKKPVLGNDGNILKGADGKVITKDVVVKECRPTMDKRDQVIQGVKELREELKKLEKRRDHVCNLADIWVREGMLNSGFYHGDLHSGNIMIDDDMATVIDFGNSTQLKQKEQKYIIGMLRAAMEGDTNLFMECFKKLLGEKDEAFAQFFNDAKQAELKEAFREVLSMGSEEETGERIMVSLLRAQELGVEIPASIWGFAQGQSRLMNSISEMNAKIKTIVGAIDSLEAMCSSTAEDYFDPIMLIQDEFIRTRPDEVRKKEIFDKTIYDLTREVDTREILKDLDKKKVDDDKDIDQIRDFEEKYLKDYRYIGVFFTREYDENNNVVDPDRYYEWHSDDWGGRIQYHFDYRGAIQAYKDFVAKWKDKVGNPVPQALRDEAAQLRVNYPFSNELFAPFGGNLIISELGDAMFDFQDNGQKLLEITDYLEKKMPIADEMIKVYEDLRLAQAGKKKHVSISALKNRFIETIKS